MRRCRTCLYPDTKPDLQFYDGVCAACVSYAKRKEIDWPERGKRLLEILDANHGECIVASSGGKDSHAIVLKLLELGARVTCVTAGTCHITEIGRQNLENLARYATTIEVSPNRTVAAKLNRLGLQLVGDISWREHIGIFSVPFRVAAYIGIPLIFYGENSQEAYGGPSGADAAFELTPRWRSEFGGFLGLRASDMIGKEGITERDMQDYELPQVTFQDDRWTPKAYFLGQFYEWNSLRNAEVARTAGMERNLPSPANYWQAENLDNAQTGLHDHMMYRKYGYGRGCAQVSVNVRAGLCGREYALEWVRQHDGIFPTVYAGVGIHDVLHRIGVSYEQLMELLDRFTNRDLFAYVRGHRPILKEFAELTHVGD